MRKWITLIAVIIFPLIGMAQSRNEAAAKDHLQEIFLHPPEAAKPWVFWYWMQAAVTREGITADLQSMKDIGIGGAYLMPIKSATNPPFITPPVAQLTPEWWAMVKFTMQEADRIGIKLAMHDCDGFALAGGPWITPELSMQKVVWTKTQMEGGRLFADTITRPENYKGYYKDIEILAYPTPKGAGVSSYGSAPKITCSLPAIDVQYLAEYGNKKSFSSAADCWLQVAFQKPFTCRSLVIHTVAPNYQSERLVIQASNDGQNFKTITRLGPPRHGWQDDDADITHDIPETTAKYFRLVYEKAASEPGAEDLDYAKWKPSLKISGIELSSEAKIHQYESKNGEVWRISKETTPQQLPAELCVTKTQIINLTDKFKNGKLSWLAPAGNWTIIRMGHTSTGHTNATGGAGNGLECDKFSTEAATIQFNNWFGEAFKHGGEDLARRVLKIFHIDSWECGSQNWSPTFAQEFQKRRGYDLLPYLPVLAGVPIQGPAESEKVLRDVRETIGELIVDKFYSTMAKLAHQKGCTFTAESVAPTMMSDGMAHYGQSDVPMGEFWFRSPTHDKPNDMLDAISGGHIYGKNIIQAEGFTQLRVLWDEHPAMLKTMADRSFALGINRLALHVSMHNPWLDRKPGMTLDGIGMFFQRDQTWWKPGKAWFDYLRRCQALLQLGHPVTDIAVFTGEEMPRRAVLPDRLVSALPGLFGPERVKSEAIRMANKDEPIISSIEDASHSANMALPEDWVDPLHGYAYDSFNKDALLRLAIVQNGRIVLPGGASYGVLVIPGSTQMNPNPPMSVTVSKKLIHLIDQGAQIIIEDPSAITPELNVRSMLSGTIDPRFSYMPKDKKVLFGPYQKENLDQLLLTRDVILKDSLNNDAKNIAWTHRRGKGFDIYFISNQQTTRRLINLSLRNSNHIPEIWDPVTGGTNESNDWNLADGRVNLKLALQPNQALFVVLRTRADIAAARITATPVARKMLSLKSGWQVQFDPKSGGPKQPVTFPDLQDWSKNADTTIRYYSGTAVYTQSFKWDTPVNIKSNISLCLGGIANMAEVYVNGINCGVIWTPPYRVNIAKALKPGINQLKIAVTNTWANRLMGDHNLPESKRITWTNAPYRLDKRNLLPAGMFGPVEIIKINDPSY